MKKISLLLLLVLASALQAHERSDEEMMSIARQQLQQVAVSHRAAPAVSSVLCASQAETYNLYSSSDGFVVVSRDDAFMPVLGYSESSYEECRQIPALQWWLDQTERSLKVKKADPNYAPRKVSFTPTPYFMTSLWGQQAPYNYLCPKINGVYTLTGCVATAMAQVLYYYKYPESSTGTSYYYLNDSSTPNTVTVQTTYDWAAMKNQYSNLATSAQKTVIGQLMRDCGYASHMTYRTTASSALTGDAAAGLVDNFQFDERSIRFAMRDYYEDSEWLSIVYAELAARRPIIYGGVDPNPNGGGHEFVLDGIDEDGKVHVNWGWKGVGNGYYELSHLEPTGIQGFSGTNYFNSDHDMIFGITPTPDENALSNPICSEWAVYAGSYSFASGTNNNIKVNLTSTSFVNIHYQRFNGSLVLHVEATDGSGKSYNYSLPVNTTGGVRPYAGFKASDGFTVSGSSDLPAGNYVAYLASKSSKDMVYRPFRCLGGPISYTLTKRANGSILFGEKTVISTVVDAVANQQVKVVQGRYNLRGQRVDGNHRGIVITRHADGTVRKVLNR